MGTWNKTRSTLIAVSETDMVTAVAVSFTDPADLRPLRQGTKSSLFSRLTAPASEIKAAEARIAAITGKRV